MPADHNGEGPSRAERFHQYNPYAEKLAQHPAFEDPGVIAALAVAFEVAQLRAEIRFGRDRRS